MCHVSKQVPVISTKYTLLSVNVLSIQTALQLLRLLQVQVCCQKSMIEVNSINANHCNVQCS